MSERMEHLDLSTRLVAELGSLSIVIGGFTSSLPVIITCACGVLAIIWYTINIYDWVQKRKRAARLRPPSNVRSTEVDINPPC